MFFKMTSIRIFSFKLPCFSLLNVSNGMILINFAFCEKVIVVFFHITVNEVQTERVKAIFNIL